MYFPFIFNLIVCVLVKFSVVLNINIIYLVTIFVYKITYFKKCKWLLSTCFYIFHFNV